MPIQVGDQQYDAVQEHMRLAAVRCASNPAILAKAVRTVREGIRLGLVDRSEVATGGDR